MREKVLNAGPKRLAEFLNADPGPARPWRQDELAAIFRHQLAAPVVLDLPDETAGASTTPASDCAEISTFDQLFHHPKPPVALLKAVKEFAKSNRDHPASPLPGEIASALYFTSILIARWRAGERISSLADNELKSGLDWVLAQPWIEERLKILVREGALSIGASTEARTPDPRRH